MRGSPRGPAVHRAITRAARISLYYAYAVDIISDLASMFIALDIYLENVLELTS